MSDTKLTIANLGKRLVLMDRAVEKVAREIRTAAQNQKPIEMPNWPVKGAKYSERLELGRKP